MSPEILLNDHGTVFIVAGLPDPNDRAVGLHLVDIATGNPDLLGRVRGLNHDRRGGDYRGSGDYRRCCNHGRSRDHGRADDRIGQHTAHDTADKTRPEISPSAAPYAFMMMVMMGGGTVMMHRRTMRRTMTSGPTAVTGSRKNRSGGKRDSENQYEFLVHFTPFTFLRFCGCNHVGNPYCVF